MRDVELQFRANYGKIFSSLLSTFGSANLDVIEDALQFAFYRALKSWKPSQVPQHKDRWLYVVARNHLLDQLRYRQKFDPLNFATGATDSSPGIVDNRLQTIGICLRLDRLKKVTPIAKVIFVLKSICGLSISEISHCLNLTSEAVHKRYQRLKSVLKTYSRDVFTQIAQNQTLENTSEIEEIIYAIFTAGYDSLEKKSPTPVNTDVCYEALSLAQLMRAKYGLQTTDHLIALFCFHLARVPARFQNGKLISFFDQDKSLWDDELLQSAFKFLRKPITLSRFYLEALICCKHMFTAKYDDEHWSEILSCYDLLLKLVQSPIVQMNRAFALYQLNRVADAQNALTAISHQIKSDNIYYSLLLGEVLSKIDVREAEYLLTEAQQLSTQNFRRDHIARLLKHQRQASQMPDGEKFDVHHD